MCFQQTVKDFPCHVDETLHQQFPLVHAESRRGPEHSAFLQAWTSKMEHEEDVPAVVNENIPLAAQINAGS